MAAIRTKNLTKIYNHYYSNIRAITDCNIEIDRGDFVAIIGDRGSGKSTLLHLLGGYERPSYGKVYHDDRDIYTLNDTDLASIYRQEIGFIFQQANLIPGLTIYENIIMPSVLNHTTYDKEFFYELAVQLHITNYLNYHPKNVSEEICRFAAIARALINQPNIVFADEPTKNISKDISKDINDLLIEYANRYQSTLIMATYNEEMAELADHMIKLNQGEIVADKKLMWKEG